MLIIFILTWRSSWYTPKGKLLLFICIFSLTFMFLLAYSGFFFFHAESLDFNEVDFISFLLWLLDFVTHVKSLSLLWIRRIFLCFPWVFLNDRFSKYWANTDYACHTTRWTSLVRHPDINAHTQEKMQVLLEGGINSTFPSLCTFLCFAGFLRWSCIWSPERH